MNNRISLCSLFNCSLDSLLRCDAAVPHLLAMHISLFIAYECAPIPKCIGLHHAAMVDDDATTATATNEACAQCIQSGLSLVLDDTQIVRGADNWWRNAWHINFHVYSPGWMARDAHAQMRRPVNGQLNGNKTPMSTQKKWATIDWCVHARGHCLHVCVRGVDHSGEVNYACDVVNSGPDFCIFITNALI